MSKNQITRRSFNKGLAAGVVATTLPGVPGCVSGGQAAPQGIVMITADDLGWLDLSSYGLRAVSTPSIDRIVNEGAAFNYAFDVVSSCSSSRASLATGHYPHTHGVMGLVHRHPEMSLPLDYPTTARTLEQLGYKTAIQGKWHLAHEVDPDEFGYQLYLDTDFDQVIRRPEDGLDFLRANQNERFYLELNYMQTHRNLFEEFMQAEGFEVAEDDGAPPDYWGLPDWPEIREEVAAYYSQIQWMDALIGEVLDELDTLKLSENTLVMFISDNGPPFPGCKTTLYDRGLGTPLAFRWPSQIAPARYDHLVTNIDVAPTVFDFLGETAPQEHEGRSLAPLLLGDPSWQPAEVIFSEMEYHASAVPARAARTSEYKYIRNLSDRPWGSGDGKGAWKDTLAEEANQTWDEPREAEELYYLPDDPLERNNLVDNPDHADALAMMRENLRAHMEQTGDFRLAELD